MYMIYLCSRFLHGGAGAVPTLHAFPFQASSRNGSQEHFTATARFSQLDFRPIKRAYLVVFSKAQLGGLQGLWGLQKGGRGITAWFTGSLSRWGGGGITGEGVRPCLLVLHFAAFCCEPFLSPPSRRRGAAPSWCGLLLGPVCGLGASIYSLDPSRAPDMQSTRHGFTRHANHAKNNSENGRQSIHHFSTNWLDMDF